MLAVIVPQLENQLAAVPRVLPKARIAVLGAVQIVVLDALSVDEVHGSQHHAQGGVVAAEQNYFGRVVA